jgi:hypothetical protein
MEFINKFLILYFLVGIVTFAQFQITSNSFQVTVFSPEYESIADSSGVYKKIDFATFTDPSRRGEYKLPTRNLILAIPPNSNPSLKILSKKENILENSVPEINPNAVKLNDSTLVYETSEADFQLLKNNSKPIAELGQKFWFRDFYCVELIINSHQFDPAKNAIIIYDDIKLEISFSEAYQFKELSPIQIKSEFDRDLKSIIYNYEIAEQFRSKSPSQNIENSDGWINYSQDYVKIAVGKDALFKITKNELSALGVPVNSIDSRTIQLFEGGSEQPVFVKGEVDGSLDDSDYILFWGTKHYGKIDRRIINADNEPYNTYLDIYTDTSYYFLTWGSANGMRYNIDSASIPGNFDTLRYHDKLVHAEENSWYQNLNNNEVANQTADWNKNKTWYWGWIFESTKNFTVDLDDVYPGKNAELFVKLTSAGSNISTNSHQVALRFNDAKIDSQNINRFKQALLSGTIDASNLINGNNKISVQNYANGTLPNFLAYDWYEIEYPCYNKLINDSLIITIPEGISNEVRRLEFSNASSSEYEIFKVTGNQKKIENYSISSGVLTFIDTVNSGEKYVIYAAARTSEPKMEYLGKFSNIRANVSQADYIALTPAVFSTKVDDYLSLIRSIYNLLTKKIEVEKIYDEFGYGYPTPESIKEFVQYAYDNWVSPKPSYLVLFGDATYDYKNYIYNNVGVKLSENYIPAYGNPVSDNWYAIWGNSPYIPQLKVGRIPILSNSDLIHYQDKIVQNYNSEYDDWNKRYLFFSGGNGNKPSELKQLKAANDSVISNVIQPRPISGNYNHFYKTSDPISDFGPYAPAEIQNAIDEGGVFISYVGHSGTATWDNSINEVNQLKNVVNRNPVISDFGCSTNKYAEPDIVCFGERFLLNNDGQALNYIGNSSLGFTSTAIPSPEFFYESFLTDSTYEIGSAHINLKSQLYEIFGTSSVYKVFALSNVILGDPAVRIKMPDLPNLTFGQNPLVVNTKEISDINDSSRIQIIVTNLGKAPSLSYTINILHYFNDELIETKSLKKIIPGFQDTLNVWIKTRGLSGEHNLEFTLDPNNTIEELNEEDNTFTDSFNLYSSALRDLLLYSNSNGKVSTVKILNPISYSENEFEIITQISDEESFTNPQTVQVLSDSLTTNIQLPNVSSKRYWLRYKINNPQYEYSAAKSFYQDKNYKSFLSDKASFDETVLEKTGYINSQIELEDDSLTISVLSAGWYAGATCVIAKNGINLLDNSFFAGMGIVVFEPTTMEIDTSAWFQLFDNLPNAQALRDLINNIPDGKIVAMGVADDGQHRLKASGLNTAIKTLGSTMIDQLQFRGSWAIIGRKGASPGDPDILEEIRGPYDGAVTLERDYIVPNTTGYLTTTQLGPVSSWDTLYVNYTKPAGSKIEVTPIGIRENGQADTLTSFGIVSQYSTLNHIDANKYPYAKLKFKLTRNTNLESPAISQIGVNHHNAAELAINYQTASLSKDTVLQNDTLKLNFIVSNVGEGRPLNLRNKVDLYKDNIFFKTVIDSTFLYLNPESAEEIEFNYIPQIEDGEGNFKFVIELDVGDRTVELYEDNNKYELPFVVIEDTVTAISSAVVSANFDGYQIYDGDYVSSNPIIEILLDYEGHFEISDTNDIEIMLNSKRVDFASLNTTYETQNNRIIFSFSPQLDDGDYTLSVLGDNIRPANSDENTFVRFFKVSSESKILYPYNYPNPFANETFFTFKLTQIPDELKIKIFTIAGRLVRELKFNREELNFDFNRIYWDGRDEDGDLLANGVYLYKIISYSNNETVSVINKAAIVR